RNIIIGAFGSAVGINMTFLLPYSLKAKGWGKAHRELSRFDLTLGLFVPFVLATSFLVIATSSQFHARADGVHSESAYKSVIDARLAFTVSDFGALPDAKKDALRDQLPQADKDMGVMLAKRNAKDLASSLEPFLGNNSQLIFGIGVLAMAVSTMIVHMMMNGYAISEAFGRPGETAIFMIGASMPALTGLLSPILWSGQTKTALVVPAAVIATTLLPIAYIIFILLMNSRKALGNELPKNRALVNGLMLIAASVASFASIWNLLGKASSGGSTGMQGIIGLVTLPLLILIGIFGFVKRNRVQN
ncbi:MAG: divalent metal cation transporter, partial [Verrucomicrobiota bacterium]